uniref:Uncharacterized protein n=1 Tax=Megaselia scalaris TaxID=36166 RepID=T1GJW0_MEGSC
MRAMMPHQGPGPTMESIFMALLCVACASNYIRPGPATTTLPTPDNQLPCIENIKFCKNK